MKCEFDMQMQRNKRINAEKTYNRKDKKEHIILNSISSLQMLGEASHEPYIAVTFYKACK